MTRRYARGPRGKRIVCKIPHGHWKILSTVATMNLNGIVTSCCFDGAIDTQMFLAFIEKFLLPNLKSGQVVVMDNLPAHKSPRIDQLIKSAGAQVMRLPPYSPDFNPIEMAISKMKSLLRKEGKRSIDELQEALGEVVRSITAEDAEGFIRHCGYDATIA
jgi:transposase